MFLVCLGSKIIQVYSCQVSEKNKRLLLFVKEKCPGGAWPTTCFPGSQTDHGSCLVWGLSDSTFIHCWVQLLVLAVSSAFIISSKITFFAINQTVKKKVGLGCFVTSIDITCKVTILLEVNHSISAEAGKPGSVASTTPLR